MDMEIADCYFCASRLDNDPDLVILRLGRHDLISAIAVDPDAFNQDIVERLNNGRARTDLDDMRVLIVGHLEDDPLGKAQGHVVGVDVDAPPIVPRRSAGISVVQQISAGGHDPDVAAACRSNIGNRVIERRAVLCAGS